MQEQQHGQEQQQECRGVKDCDTSLLSATSKHCSGSDGGGSGGGGHRVGGSLHRRSKFPLAPKPSSTTSRSLLAATATPIPHPLPSAAIVGSSALRTPANRTPNPAPGASSSFARHYDRICGVMNAEDGHGKSAEIEVGGVRGIVREEE